MIPTLLMFAVVSLATSGVASSGVRVVGGTTVAIQSAPWSVLVSYQPGAFRYICTGSVIDASHVVTAAHCLYGTGTLIQPSAVSVLAGSSNFFSPSTSDAPQSRTVSSFRIHPGYAYAATSQPDDVAVLALAVPLDLSGAAVRAVALPPPNATFPARAAVAIAGFGGQDPAVARPSGDLETITGTADPQNTCGEYTGTQLIDIYNAVIMCSASTKSAICHGDSGAGVVITGSTPELIGVVNDSQAECTIGSRTVSTYLGAPEILSFIQGDDQPPTATRPDPKLIPYRFAWPPPLVVGNTLTCSTTGWPTTVQISYAFVNEATGEILQTNAGGRYLLPQTSAGTTIGCSIGLTNSGGTTIISGTPAGPVAPAPHAKIVPLPTLTVKRGHALNFTVVLSSPPGLAGTFSVCAVPTASVAKRVCRSTHKPFGAAGKFPFSLTLKTEPNAPITTARITINATAGSSTATTTAMLRITRP